MIEHTIQGDVAQLDQLRGGNGEFLSSTVNVVGYVYMYGLELNRIQVRFGSVGGDFFCSQNWLTSLEGAPSAVGGDFYCSHNRLTSLVGVHRILRRIDGGLYLWGNPIVSGGIGLLLIKGLARIHADQPAFEIIGRHLGQGKCGLLRCQEVLHDAGFEEFARL